MNLTMLMRIVLKSVVNVLIYTVYRYIATCSLNRVHCLALHDWTAALIRQ